VRGAARGRGTIEGACQGRGGGAPRGGGGGRAVALLPPTLNWPTSACRFNPCRWRLCVVNRHACCVVGLVLLVWAWCGGWCHWHTMGHCCLCTT
jgi:hypothetical protein